MFVWVHEENTQTNRGQICTEPRQLLPSLRYFQHLSVTIASAAQTYSESTLSDSTSDLALISERLAQRHALH